MFQLIQLIWTSIIKYKKNHMHILNLSKTTYKSIHVRESKINKQIILKKKMNHILRFKIKLYKSLESVGTEKKLLEKKTVLMHVLHELSG